MLTAEKIVADQDLNNALIENNYLFIPGKKFNEKEKFFKNCRQKGRKT